MKDAKDNLLKNFVSVLAYSIAAGEMEMGYNVRVIHRDANKLYVVKDNKKYCVTVERMVE